MEKTYKIEKERRGCKSITEGTLSNLVEHFSYTLEVGASWNKRINTNPKTIKALVKNINASKAASAANGNPDSYYSLVE